MGKMTYEHNVEKDLIVAKGRHQCWYTYPKHPLKTIPKIPDTSTPKNIILKMFVRYNSFPPTTIKKPTKKTRPL